MNTDSILALQRFAKELDASSFNVGQDGDSRADLIRGLIAYTRKLEEKITDMETKHNSDMNHIFNHKEQAQGRQ